ncbi:hypothetical protein CC86DRAFT_30747 [Ophiobolus disseminans]|uniref:Peptidase A1 domain-containing protein n=1 Tax=Ophiobolus disseminans TaxID=1469910 RepID=A0A6A7A092_9PLEO|nr:hypothetical protein CC86DRAFT_30747 [Ophiobolus disseminans]
MLRLFTFGCLSYLARAAALYDYAQQPLRDHKEGPFVGSAQEPVLETPTERFFGFEFDVDHHYIFPAIKRSAKPITLGALQKIRTYRAQDFPYSVGVSVPLNSAYGGDIVVRQGAESGRERDVNDVGSKTWIDFDGPRAEHIPLLNIGVRNGGTVSMQAQVARLDLDTPYISIPPEMFAVLLQATNASESHFADCRSQAWRAFPDLVFGLDAQDGEAHEFVVRPEEYLSQPRGRCELLVRNAEEHSGGEIVLGWAAIKGRSFVLDWVAGKMGLEDGRRADYEPWP